MTKSNNSVDEKWIHSFAVTDVCMHPKKFTVYKITSVTLYVGPFDDYSELLSQFEPNPFAVDFVCVPNDVKGGIYITENILYAAVRETDWSLDIAELIVTTDWTCSNCDATFNFTGIQKLQHTNDCKVQQS